MPTVHQTPDVGPLSPPGTTPYSRRCAVVAAAVQDEAARRGWLPGPPAA
jgi:hypothetical protein